MFVSAIVIPSPAIINSQLRFGRRPKRTLAARKSEKNITSGSPSARGAAAGDDEGDRERREHARVVGGDRLGRPAPDRVGIDEGNDQRDARRPRRAPRTGSGRASRASSARRTSRSWQPTSACKSVGGAQREGEHRDGDHQQHEPVAPAAAVRASSRRSRPASARRPTIATPGQSADRGEVRGELEPARRAPR